MMRKRIAMGLLLAGGAITPATVGHAEPLQAAATGGLFWPQKVQEINVSSAEASREVHYQFQNTTDRKIELKAIRISCSCLTAQLPEKRRYLPKEKGAITLTFEPGGRRGKLTRHIVVQTSASLDRLVLNINLPSARSEEEASSSGNSNVSGEK